jgi:flagellar hook-length control protein FliK
VSTPSLLTAPGGGVAPARPAARGAAGDAAAAPADPGPPARDARRGARVDAGDTRDAGVPPRDRATARPFADLVEPTPRDPAPIPATPETPPEDPVPDAGAPERLLALLAAGWPPAMADAPHAPDARLPGTAASPVPTATSAPAAPAGQAWATAAGPAGAGVDAVNLSTAATPSAEAGGRPALPSAPPMVPADATQAGAPPAAGPSPPAPASRAAAPGETSAVAAAHPAAAGPAAFAPATAAAQPADAAAAVAPGDAAPSVPGAVATGAGLPATRAEAPPILPPLALPADPGAGFDDGLGTRIAWMADQRLGHAEIRLNPEHAGPIDVRVDLDGDRVDARFHSASAEVRQALEASLPRLRELLGQHGLQLGQADVGGHARDRAPPASTSADRPGGRDAAGPEGADVPRLPRVATRGLLDAWA